MDSHCPYLLILGLVLVSFSLLLPWVATRRAYRLHMLTCQQVCCLCQHSLRCGGDTSRWAVTWVELKRAYTISCSIIFSFMEGGTALQLYSRITSSATHVHNWTPWWSSSHWVGSVQVTDELQTWQVLFTDPNRFTLSMCVRCGDTIANVKRPATLFSMNSLALG